jgi:hypothetical protein
MKGDVWAVLARKELCEVGHCLQARGGAYDDFSQIP